MEFLPNVAFELIKLENIPQTYELEDLLDHLQNSYSEKYVGVIIQQDFEELHIDKSGKITPVKLANQIEIDYLHQDDLDAYLSKKFKKKRIQYFLIFFRD